MRLALVLAAAHAALVLVTFAAFGLGLEGERGPGHDLLWVLLQPLGALGLPLVFLPLNSALWGVALALLTGGTHFLGRGDRPGLGSRSRRP